MPKKKSKKTAKRTTKKPTPPVTRLYLKWLVPLALLGAIAPLTPWIDRTIASWFYGKTADGFYNPWQAQFLYDYGVVPAILTGIGAIGAFLLSYLGGRFQHWRAPALMLILTLTLGSGVLINGVLKEHWGRPRPVQIEEFGGNQPFRPFYQPDFRFDDTQKLRSFPCGHCSMGYFFFTLCLLARRFERPNLYRIGLILALTLGGALGVARMMQGGHFFSDVFAGAVIMWLTAVAVD